MSELSPFGENIQGTLPDKRPNFSPEEFIADWEKQYGNFDNPIYRGKPFYYQAPKSSPNAQFSSKGWKLHVQFEKGHEKQLAELLNAYGQYFKIEGSMGTYFNSNTNSGSTIYVGPRENLEKTITLVQEKFSSFLSSKNPATTVFGKKVYDGSGSDESIGYGLAARFDIQKTEFKEKYSEYGFATWLEFRGLPVLQKDILQVRELEDVIEDDKKQYDPSAKQKAYLELQSLFRETEKELLKDFGQEFVYGKTEMRTFDEEDFFSV